MPGTPARAKATHRVAVRREDEVGRVGIVSTEVIHEPGGGTLNLGLRRSRWNRSRIYPCSCQLTSGVGDMGATTSTTRRASRNALTILGVDVIPGTSANVAEEVLDVGLGLFTAIAACGETGIPLAPPPTDVDHRSRLDRPTLVHQVGASSFKLLTMEDAHEMRRRSRRKTGSRSRG